MMSTPISGELMELFVEETTQMIAAMRKGLATLAKTQDTDTEAKTLKVLVRSAHTIVGSSGMAGFGDLQELAHGLEQVLRKLAETRGPDATLLQPLSETIDDCERQLKGKGIDQREGVEAIRARVRTPTRGQDES